MTPWEKLGLAGTVITAIMAVCNKIVVQRRRNVADRLEVERELQRKQNAKAIERAKSSRCLLCGRQTFPSALEGKCADCWLSGRAFGGS